MTDKQTAANPGRLVQLDSLRGLAAIAVLFFHYLYHFHNIQPERAPQLTFLQGGHYGVELFFILSGFVITLTTEKKSTIGSFAKARFFRLYPVYWAAVLFTFASLHILGPMPEPPVGVKALLGNFTMFAQFLKVPMIDGVYWTLQVEMLFYFFIAGLLLVKLKDRILEGLTFLVCLSIALYFCPPHIVTKAIKILLVLKFIHLFALGCLIYHTRYKGLLAWSPKALVIILLCLTNHTLNEGWISTLVVIPLAATMYAAVHFNIPLLQSRVLVFFGAISYSLYLVHQNFGYGVIIQLTDRGVNYYLAAAVAGALSILVATILYLLIERPVNNWAKGPKTPKPAPAPTSETPA